MRETHSSDSNGVQPVELSNVSVRMSNFDKVVGMFTNQVELDCDFVINAIEDLGVRDALLHSLSDKFLIDCFGDDEEHTYEDRSVFRQNFADFLFHVCTETRFTGIAYSLVAGLAILDDETELGLEIAQGAVDDGYKASLLDSFVKFGAHVPTEVMHKNFVKSVEDNPIDKCFIF